MSSPLTVLQISSVYTLEWFEVMSWSWTEILKNSDEQSDRLSYLLLDLCLVKLFLVLSMAYGLGQSSYLQPLEKTCLSP